MDNHLFKNKYRIQSTRLKDWDYSWDGAYFVTICTKNHDNGFGRIIGGELKETKLARIVRKSWLDLPNHYKNCVLDEFVIMPNHIHGIIFLNSGNLYKNLVVTDFKSENLVETGLKPVSTIVVKNSLSEIMRGFKTFSAKSINKIRHSPGRPFWQSRFYDHIIRSEGVLSKIRQYIKDNPFKWHLDELNPENKNYYEKFRNC